MCIDCKLNFDGYAAFRQKSFQDVMRTHQIDPCEAIAKKAGFDYIPLDGNIGCIVNGAGLTMATMDLVKTAGGEPANFCDLGVNVTLDQFCTAYELMYNDDRVNVILINVFFAFVSCDKIARSIIEALHNVKKEKPVVVRMEGINVSLAREMLENSGLCLLVCDEMQEAADRVVKIGKIVELGKTCGLNVELTVPSVIIEGMTN